MLILKKLYGLVHTSAKFKVFACHTFTNIYYFTITTVILSSLIFANYVIALLGFFVIIIIIIIPYMSTY